MAALERIFTRALKGSGAGLGNAAPGTGYTAQGKSYGPTNPGAGSRNRKAPIAGTRSITYNSPGQPLPLDIAADQLSQEDYLGSVYVMRCVRLIAETLAASPFVAGPNPFDPGNYNLDAPLARLLGPATPQAPGGPNPHLTARAFWIWSVVQYITSGRWGWELQWDGQPAKSNIVGLWPLVSIALAPIPIDGKTEIWSGFQYQTPTGFVQLSTDRVCYAWRPAITDWRMPESVLQSARLPIYMQRAIDRYMVGLLKNNMVATTMVVAPPFDEADQRRSWEDQFLSEFTGIDRAGGTIFGYIEPDEDDPAGKPLVQVERIAQTPVEASLATLSTTAKNDVCIALGTPRSLLGDASQRIYCADDQTEVLTSDGWLTHDKVGAGATILTLNHRTGLAEWQPIDRVNRFDVSDEPMLRMAGRTHDSLTSADHRWPVIPIRNGPRRGAGAQWQLSQHLTENHRLITAAPVADLPVEPKYTDDFVELVAWHWTEGHVSYNPSGNLGRTIITQSEKANPGHCRRIENVLRGLFGGPRDDLRGTAETPAWRVRGSSTPDMKHYVLSLPVTKMLEEVAPERCPTPRFIQALTKAQLELFIDVSLMADGWRTNENSKVISQSRSQRLDGLELAAILSGRTPYRWQAKGGRQSYFMAISDRTVARVPGLTPVDGDQRSARREWVSYTGTVWCPTVRNGTWLARRNGKVYFTGNSNAGAENRNFWTITMINIIAEIQDHVNLRLAPRLEQDTVGWFDLSKVEALQPPSTFAPPDVAEAINAGILDAEQAASILGIPPPGDQGDVDVETTILGEEAEKSGAIGGRSDPVRLRLRQWGFRDDIDRSQWVQVKRTVSMNSYLWREPSKRVRPKVDLRPRIRAYSELDHAESVRRRTEGIRALATAKATTAKVHRSLARSYPEDVLDWVDGADWSGPTRVPLEDIKMDRRPGGRDMQRVDGIAKAIADDPEGAAAAPVVLVKTPSGALKVADGYHRTLAHKRLGHKSVPAYVGEVDDDNGPWDKEMHDAKQNRSAAVTARSRQISRDPKLLSSTFASEPRGIPRGPRVITRALDTWYGTGGSTQPSPPKTVDVSEILTEAHPYVVESEDNFNGVPNHVVEEIAEALTQAGGEDEDEQPIKGVASTLKSAAATTAY